MSNKKALNNHVIMLEQKEKGEYFTGNGSGNTRLPCTNSVI